MVERHDWVEWDNSMKSHIDQIEVKWKNDVVIALEQAAVIERKQTEFNDLVIVAVEESMNEHKRTKALIAICYCLFFIDAFVAVMAFSKA